MSCKMTTSETTENCRAKSRSAPTPETKRTPKACARFVRVPRAMCERVLVKLLALAYVQTGKRRAGGRGITAERTKGRERQNQAWLVEWMASHTKGIFLHKIIREMSQSPRPIWPVTFIQLLYVRYSNNRSVVNTALLL